MGTGCEVESIFLNIEAVNTHRERPTVRRIPVTWEILYENLWKEVVKEAVIGKGLV